MSSLNIVVYDIETKFSFEDVGGREKFADLGISVLGMYDYETGKFLVYDENELGKFAVRLRRRPLLVGFNNKRFDTPILQKNVSVNLGEVPQLDIMDELQKVLGHRVSLQSVAQATLGLGKSARGLDAIRFYREGRMEELKRYCLDDVRITRDIFEYGAKHGELFYTPKFGSGRARAPVNWKVEHPETPSKLEPQQSLF